MNGVRRDRWWLGQGMVWLLSGMLLFAIPHVAGKLPQQLDRVESGVLQCRAEQVLDGDTLLAVCGPLRLRIRLLGIDAPEMGQAPYGTLARDALRLRLRGAFTAKVHGLDVYERTLAVLVDGAGDVNAWLVREGFAVAYRGKDTPDAYVAAERAAKREKRGVWQAPGLQQDPRTWRRYFL